VLHHAVGEYEELKGWKEDLRECRQESDLPAAAREYLQFLTDCVGVPIALVGVGPGADDVIWTAARPPTAAGSPATGDPLPAKGPAPVQVSRR